MAKTPIDPPICVALDQPDLASARRLLDALAGIAPVFKVGLQLFTSEGPRAVEEVLSRGADVFLDLKCNDIPKTVAGAVTSAAKIGAAFLTIHSGAGRASIRAAVDAADPAGGGGPTLLVVSVLTSLGDDDLRELGVGVGGSAQVDAMARLATDEGAPGLVLAGAEVERVRSAYPDLFLLVPGIRPAGTRAGDQKRTATPASVIADGADLIVLGRVLAEAADPAATAEAIVEDIRGVRSQRVGG